MIPATINELIGKKFQNKSEIVTICEILDFIPREAAAAIMQSYAVVFGDGNEYVLFERGEIQDTDGVYIGEKVLFGDDCDS